MQYTGIKYGTKVLVTSGFYEGQEVIVESWRNAHGPCTRRDLHDTRYGTSASTSSRDYFVRFSNGIARWVSCDILSDRTMRASEAPIQHDMLASLNRTNDELRGKIEVISKLYRELDMKYIDALKSCAPGPSYIKALERVYDLASRGWPRHELDTAMSEVRRLRP